MLAVEVVRVASDRVEGRTGLFTDVIPAFMLNFIVEDPKNALDTFGLSLHKSASKCRCKMTFLNVGDRFSRF